MPWTIVDGHPECDDGQVAVVKEDEDGNPDMSELEGCHDSKEAALNQIAALEASEGEGRSVQRRALPVNVRENDGKDTITFEISNTGVDRHGTRLLPGGAKLENYKENPVVLYSHGFGPKGDVPIGRAENVFTRDESLFAEVRFDQQDDFAQEIQRKVEDGFLSAASVGFEPLSEPEEREMNGKEVPTFKEWELLEFSVVSVPSNPDALVESRHDDIIDQMADRLADEVTSRVTTRIEERLDDAMAANGVDEDGSDDDEPPSAREVASDDSQADGSRDEPTKEDLRRKLRLAQARVDHAPDEDELIASVERKLGIS